MFWCQATSHYGPGGIKSCLKRETFNFQLLPVSCECLCLSFLISVEIGWEVDGSAYCRKHPTLNNNSPFTELLLIALQCNQTWQNHKVAQTCKEHIQLYCDTKGLLNRVCTTCEPARHASHASHASQRARHASHSCEPCNHIK